MKSTRDVILRPASFGEAVAFYEKLFPVTMRDPRIVGFETGAFQLFIERSPSQPAHDAVFEMVVADPASKKRELVAQGCTVIEEDPAIPRCYMRDPFGLVFNLAAG